MQLRTSQRFAWLWGGLVALGCGGSDATVVKRPPAEPIDVASSTHVSLRRGNDVSRFCAATKGELSAFAVIEPSSVVLYTSTSAALEEASFSAGPPLPALETFGPCRLVATDDGFTLAWSGTTPDGTGVLVQRLSNDG